MPSAYRQQVESDCAALEIAPARDAFVFPADSAGLTAPLPSTMTQKYRRLATRLGLCGTRLPAPRHQSATKLLTAG